MAQPYKYIDIDKLLIRIKEGQGYVHMEIIGRPGDGEITQFIKCYRWDIDQIKQLHNELGEFIQDYDVQNPPVGSP